MRSSTALNGSTGNKKGKSRCLNCGNPITNPRRGKKFCNTTCRVQYWYQKQSGTAQRILDCEQRITRIERTLGLK